MITQLENGCTQQFNKFLIWFVQSELTPEIYDMWLNMGVVERMF